MATTEISRPVCILGLGLIGGSMLQDLHASGHPCYGYNRSPSACEDAQQAGYDVSHSLEEVLRRAAADDALIVLATPMPAIAGLLDRIAELAPNCGFTDVVSVKAQVYDLVLARGMQERYVGGHPMAGTADSGWTAAHQGLFQGAAWVVTFDHAVDLEPANPSTEWVRLWTDVTHLATRLGAEVIPARVQQHDRAVARISHLPHVFAEALAIVGDQGGALSLSLAASSFRDGTRVAGSAPSLVRAMCETNHVALVQVLDEALELLSDARANLTAQTPNLGDLVDAGYGSRIRYEARSGRATGAAQAPAVSNRPVIRLQPGQDGWVNQLIQAENVGARVEVIEAPQPS